MSGMFVRRLFAAKVFLTLIGIGWCIHQLRNLRDDIREFRTTKVADVRIALLAGWLITALIFVGLVLFVPGIVTEFLQLLRW